MARLNKIVVGLITAIVLVVVALFYVTKWPKTAGGPSIDFIEVQTLVVNDSEIRQITLNKTLTPELKEALAQLIANSTIKLGSPNAPIVVVEYIDPVCPACIWRLENETEYILNGSRLYIIRYFPLFATGYFYFYNFSHVDAPFIASVEVWLSLKCIYEKRGQDAVLDAITKMSDIARYHLQAYNETGDINYFLELPIAEEQRLRSYGCTYNLTLDEALTIVKEAWGQMAAELKTLGIYNETLSAFGEFDENGLYAGSLSPQLVIIAPNLSIDTR